MKNNIVGMEANMGQLLEKIMSVQSRSDGVNTSLFEKREHIEKLHRTRNLLRKVQVLYTMGGLENLQTAKKYYASTINLTGPGKNIRALYGVCLVGRIKQKRGYKDQWPWNIRIYTDDSGKNKGDACLAYEDPSAAHSAGGFYNNYDMRGYRINVTMAEKSAPRDPPAYGHGGGGGRGGSRGSGGYGGGGGDRRRDNYRDGGSSGPDRHNHGG